MRSQGTVFGATALLLSLTAAAVVLSLVYDLGRWPLRQLALWWLAMALWSLPFVVILAMAANRRTELPAFTLGFAGAAAAGILATIGRALGAKDVEFATGAQLFISAYMLTLGLLGLLIAGAVRAWWKSRPLAPAPRLPLLVSFSGIVMGAVLVPLAIHTLPARSLEHKPEALPVADLRQINFAQVAYRAQYGDGIGYAPTFTELGPPPTEKIIGARWSALIDEVLAGGEKHGYRFTLTPTERDAQGRVLAYSITAEPMPYNVVATHRFYLDQSGIVRWTAQNRPATSADPPVPVISLR